MSSWPEAAPLAVEPGAGSPVLESLIRGPGAALPALLLVGATGEPAGWAVDAAVAVARAWVGTGRRVVLIDLDVRGGTLHERLAVTGDEGIADHFEFGTSLRLLARAVDDGGWTLVPAGLWLSDPAELLEAPAWTALIAEAAATDATLLLYAPADAPGLPVLARRVGAVLSLGGGPIEGVRPYSVVGALVPPAPAAPVEAEAPPAPVVEEPPPPPPPVDAEPPAKVRSAAEEYERVRLPKDPRAREALIADLRHRQRAALMQPPPVFGGEAAAEAPHGVRPGELAGAFSPEAAGILEEPASLGTFPVLEAPSREAARPRRPLFWTLLAVLLLSLLAGAWHFGRLYLEGRRARLEADALASEPVREPAPIPPLPAVDTVLGYAVALEAHPQLPDARERVRELRAALPQAGFFIAPLVREGALYYHVMAGPVGDSAAAGALMDTLIARRHKTGGTPADVRQAPLAFLLGEYLTQDSATARVAAVERFEIPAYVLPLDGPPPRWRVYAGGYGGPAEAEVMRQLLQSAGVPDSLVPRTGRTGR